MWPETPWRITRLKVLVTQGEGQDLVEYAFIIAMIALGVVTSLKPMAVLLSTMFSNLAAAFVNFLS
jgi:Flp pilus assembly pilin Flp